MVKLNLRIRATAFAIASLLSSCAPTGGAGAEACPQIEFGVFHQQHLNGTRSVKGPEGQTIFFEKLPIASLRDISQAQLGEDEATVLVNFKPDAAERLKSMTTGNSGVRLAFVVDGEAPMAVVWEGDYGIEDGRMQLSFQSEDTARELVRTVGWCMEGGSG